MTHPIKRYSQTKYLISQYWSFYRNEITSRSCKMKEWITEIGIISTKLSELYATLSLCLTWQNHEKIRKVDTKCTFLFRNYYFSRTEYLLIPSKPWIMKHLEMVTRLAVTVACALFQSQSAIYCLKSSKRKKYFHTLSLAEDWFSYRRQSVDDKLLWEGSIPAVSLVPSKQNIEPAGSAHLAARVKD